MKVFISWSGPKSRRAADTLHSWLPLVINAIEPWTSSTDIDKGTRWSASLADQLEQTRVGLICLTRDNLDSPWILFEAGALSKTLENTFVCPYLIDVEPSEIRGPLNQFQLTRAEKEDTRQLLHTINRALGFAALPTERLNMIFDRWWPDLEKSFQAIHQESHFAQRAEPTEREMLEELLSLVRQRKEDASLLITDDYLSEGSSGSVKTNGNS
jgi:hypothetical protein